MTDAAGRFAFPVVAPGTYRLRVLRIGYPTWLSPPIDVRALFGGRRVVCLDVETDARYSDLGVGRLVCMAYSFDGRNVQLVDVEDVHQHRVDDSQQLDVQQHVDVDVHELYSAPVAAPAGSFDKINAPLPQGMVADFRGGFSSDSERLLYASNHPFDVPVAGTSAQLWVARVDGSERTPIVTLPAERRFGDFQPTPDFSRAVYVADATVADRTELWSVPISGGTPVKLSGALVADGARVGTDASFGPGRSLEFAATFAAAPFQHVGFGVTYEGPPWAIFSTGAGGTTLLARSHDGATATDTPLGSALLGGPHRERVMGALRKHAPTWCLQFPGTFGSTKTLEQLHEEVIGATKERMLREFGDAVGILTASAPLILLLEDLHWCDYSTLDLISLLARRRNPSSTFARHEQSSERRVSNVSRATYFPSNRETSNRWTHGTPRASRAAIADSVQSSASPWITESLSPIAMPRKPSSWPITSWASRVNAERTAPLESVWSST